MTSLIIGGAGFIGSHLVDRLIDNGENVIVVDNLSTGANHNPKAHYYYFDICDCDLTNIMIKYNVSTVYHLAAQINLRKSYNDPIFDANTNILGTIKAITAAKTANVDRFIFTSTGGAMYSENDYMPWTEDLAPSPKSPYALSKLCAEKYLQLLMPDKYVILRLANVYGPRQNPHGEAGVISIFFDNLKNNEVSKIFGDGEHVRDYIYIDDVINAIELAKTIPVNNIYNVSRGVGTSVNDIAQLILFNWYCDAELMPIPIEYEPERPGELKKSILNSKKLNDFGWLPGVDIVEGIKLTYDYINRK